MAEFEEMLGRCSNCGQNSKVKVYNSVNAAAEPELKDLVLGGRLFLWECPHCGRNNLIRHPLLYHDPESRLMIFLQPEESPLAEQRIAALFESDEQLRSYNARLVREAGELIEKVKIFDAGLDDVVIELCKYVTCKEMEGEFQLKFLKMDGSDNDMIFTYPKDGKMEMISVGFNVYEDCRGIVMRTPALKEKATGLRQIDSRWLSMFF